MEIKEARLKISQGQWTAELQNYVVGILKKYERGELVEVVRCKDCKYQNGGTCGYWTDDNYKPAVKDSGYCNNYVPKE